MHVHIHTNLTILELQCCHLDAPVQYPNLHLDGVQHLKQLTHTQIILFKFVVTQIYSQLYNHVTCIVLF